MPHLVDTIVMANLGYWQMKVSPGVWYLQLAPGRSADLYILKEIGDKIQGTPQLKLITIDDLRGKLVRLEVVKKKGKEREDLLAPSTDEKLVDDERKVKTRILSQMGALIPLVNLLMFNFRRIVIAGIPTS